MEATTTTSKPATPPVSPAHILNRMGREFRNEIDRLKAIETIILSHPEWVQSDSQLQKLIRDNHNNHDNSITAA